MRPHPRIRKAIKWGGLALALLLAGVWVRSECVRDHWEWRSTAVITFPGVICTRNRRSAAPEFWHASEPREAGLPHVWAMQYPPPYKGGLVIVPLWIPLAPTLLITAAAWRLDTLARRRARPGVCPTCQYDRAGLAPGALCPECGSPASGKRAATGG